MRKVLLFPETLRIRTNHLLSLFSLITVCLFIITLLIYGRAIYTSFQKGFSSGCTYLRSIMKYQIIGIGITLFAWFIVSLSFRMSFKTGSATTIPGDYIYDMGGGETMVQIDESEKLFEIKSLYEEPEMYSKLNIFTGNLALYILLLLIFAGFTITLSFGNRLLLNIAIFKIYLACMILLGGLLMQYWSNELGSQLPEEQANSCISELMYI